MPGIEDKTEDKTGMIPSLRKFVIVYNIIGLNINK